MTGRRVLPSFLSKRGRGYRGEIFERCVSCPCRLSRRWPSRAYGGEAGNRPSPPNARECAWRGDTESIVPAGSNRSALRYSIRRQLAAKLVGAKSRNSLALPDLDREGLKLARGLIWTFRRLLTFWRDLRRLRNSLFAPSLLGGICRLFDEPPLLEDIRKEVALGRIGNAVSTEAFPGLR